MVDHSNLSFVAYQNEIFCVILILQICNQLANLRKIAIFWRGIAEIVVSAAMEDKREDYYNTSMLWGVTQLCKMICIHMSSSYVSYFGTL